MRRSLMLASVLTLALTGTSTVVSADADRGGLKGVLRGEVDFAAAQECPLGMLTVSDAVGTLNHLGRTEMHSEHCTPADAYNPQGEMTFVAADGDRLETVYNGFVPYPAPGDDSIWGTGDVEILGGTGRFVDASGGLMDGDWDTFAYVIDIDFPGFLPDGGFPPGPWPAMWTIDLDEIDY